MRTTRSVGCGIVYYNALDEDVDVTIECSERRFKIRASRSLSVMLFLPFDIVTKDRSVGWVDTTNPVTFALDCSTNRPATMPDRICAPLSWVAENSTRLSGA